MKGLMASWLKKLFTNSDVRPLIRIIEREPNKITVEEWRSDEALCAQAKSVLQSPIVMRMIQTLNNTHPAFFVFTEADLQMRAVQQARCEGYTMAIANLELLAKFQKTVEQPQPTFQEEELPEDEVAGFRVKINGK